MYPDATLIRRNGEVDAWDNDEFRAAVEAQNKSQIILAGITTDVCKFDNHLFAYYRGLCLLACCANHPIPKTRYRISRPLPPCRRLHRLRQHRSQRHLLF